MRECVRRPHTRPTRPAPLAARTLLLVALLSSPFRSDSQSLQTPSPGAPRSLSATAEMPSEEIFSRFASRVLFLICDVSADALAEASGVLVSADGFVVTNAHVVEGCRRMTATQINGSTRRSFEPVLKYYDKKSDTAVLKVEGQGFEFFALPTRAVRVGERVYAIGNPRGLEQSISEGIVSGVREEDGISWIQHSAPISPGSSGGALISSRGELLGINSWSVRESQGLNFAVPASTLNSAYSGAQAVRGFLKLPGSPPASPETKESGPPSSPNPAGSLDRPEKPF
jgi:S1-C subfamily serine protease